MNADHSLHITSSGTEALEGIRASGTGDDRMIEPNWYALLVRSRSEFVTARELGRKGIEHFLPTVTRQRQWADRKKAVDFPLFPGYLFVHVRPSAQEFLSVRQAPGIVTLVSLEPNHPAVIPPEEIESLKLVLGNGTAFDVFPGLKDGTSVRIKRGPLQGAVGILEKRAGHDMFLVNIDILGRCVGTKICADDIEMA